MAGGKGHIGFTLPEQRKPGRDSFNTKPRKVAAWIAELPMGNVGETARQVFGALHQSNRLRIGWEERFRLLEALRPPLAYLGQSLQKRYTGLPFPLQAKTLRIAALAADLYGEMALGYKIAIEDMLSRSFLFRDRRALTVMVHRALRYLNRALLTSYQVYSPPRGEVWADLHRLYRFAETRRLHQASVTDQEQEVLPKTSIATAYKQALLLALASPYRLRQGEVSVVSATLEVWAHLARLLPYAPDADPSTPLFVLDLGSNAEPTHLAFNHFSCQNDLCRLLDLAHLRVTVHEELERVSTGSVTELKRRFGNTLSVDMLRRLALAWGVPPKRGFDRNATRGTAEVVVGLGMVHRAIGGEATGFGDTATAQLAATPAFSGAATFESRPVRAAETRKTDVWNIYQPRPGAPAPSKPKSQVTAPQPPSPLEPQRWDIRDESDGGYRIARGGSDTQGIHVGDLIGLHSSDAVSDGNRVIGIVRWFRHSGPEELEVGVQNISHHGIAAAARTRLSSGGHTEYQRTILLPQSREQPPSLLAPPLLFSVGSLLLVAVGGREHHLQLTGLLEATGSFAQFVYDDLDGTGDSTGHETGQQPDQPSDYSSLWTEL